jgi:hypothetical protein
LRKGRSPGTGSADGTVGGNRLAAGLRGNVEGGSGVAIPDLQISGAGTGFRRGPGSPLPGAGQRA